MAVTPSDAQVNAIKFGRSTTGPEYKKSNVLVNAGAGSGKTFVLKERIAANLQEDGVELDEVLILTFTKAASNEMKERIIKKILDVPELKDKLVDISKAHIQTYDSYQQFLVNKYGSLIGINEKVKVASEDIILVMVNKLIDQKLEELYLENDPIFSDLVFKYLDGKEYKLKEIIYSLYKAFNKSKIEDIDKWIDFYNNPSFEQYLKDLVTNFFTSNSNQLKETLSQISYDKWKEQINEKIGLLLNSKTFDEIKENLPLLKETIILRTSKNTDPFDAEMLPQIRGYITKLKELKNIDLDVFENADIPNIKNYTPILLKVVKDIKSTIDNFKKENNYYNFDDIAGFCLKILEEHEEVRNEIKNKLKIIMVDEYQDTNNNQERFLKLISDNNMFMVGDFKQSIYRFRGANPSIFVNKFNDYEKGNGGIGVMMDDNYRSRKEITNTVNVMFDVLMTLENGGFKYNKINPGNKDYEKKENIDKNAIYGFKRIKYIKQKGVNKDEIEAHLMAQSIKNRINSKELVYASVIDEKTKKEKFVLRPIQYKDIAIIAIKKKKFPIYSRVFASKEYGIPLNVIFEEKLLDHDASISLISILRFISAYNNSSLSAENKEATLKTLFVSIVRSHLFRYSDDQIYELISSKEYVDDEVYKCLEKLSIATLNMNLSDTYLIMINSLNMIKNAAKLEDSLKAVELYSLFYSRCKEMDKLSYTLEDFINYIDTISSSKDKDLSIKVKRGKESENAVTVCTIHESKGLEYNLCYFPLLSAVSRNGSSSSQFISTTEGVYLRTDCNDKNIFYTIFNKDEKLENEYEDIRKLYVALTRPKEEGVFIYGVDEEGKTKNSGLLKFISQAYPSLDVFKDDEYVNLKIEDSGTKSNNSEGKPKDIDFRTLNYEFIKGKAVHQASKSIDDTTDDSTLSFGTKLHLYLEAIDFDTFDTSFIKDKKEKGIIDKVVNNHEFKEILRNGKIFKEYQFKDDIQNINGIIDLLVIKNDQAYIIDYKTKHIDDEAYNNQLRIYKNYILNQKDMNLSQVSCYLLSLMDNKLQKIDVE